MGIEPGDSGAPVFAIESDGTVALVGLATHKTKAPQGARFMLAHRVLSELFYLQGIPSGNVWLTNDPPPILTNIDITSTPISGDTYQPGETIEFTYTFSEPVVLYPGLKPSVLFLVPVGEYRRAHYDAERSTAAGDDKLVFTWEVESGFDGELRIGPGLPANPGSIGNFDGEPLVGTKLENWRSAQIGQKGGGPQMELGVFSGAPVQDSDYQPGELIHVATRWDRPVKVDPDNPPYVLIFMNSSPNGVRAEYDQALTEAQVNRWVMFSYQVQIGDEDDDQLWLGNKDNGVNSLGNAAGITDYSGNAAEDSWEPDSYSRYGAKTPSGAPAVSSAGFVFQYRNGQLVIEQIQPGEVVEFRVRFDRPVRVDESDPPWINLHINSEGTVPVRAYYDPQRTAVFHEPSVLSFTYTVQDGDSDDDRVWVGNDNLKNAGSITDYVGNAARGGGLGTSLGHNVGDTGAPSITNVAFTSRPLFAGQYQPGEVIEITLTADESVKVDDSNPPNLLIHVGGRYPQPAYDADLSLAAGSNKLVFTWTVEDGYSDDDGFLIGPGDFRNAGGVTDWSGKAINTRLPGYWGTDLHHKVGDLGAPLITDVSATSSPASGNTYSSGETIEITLTASEPLTVPTGQEPQLVVEVGSQYPAFRYDRGRSQAAGGNHLVFTWTVQDGYQDDNGILGLLDSLRDTGAVVDGSGNALNAELHQYWNFYQHRVAG